MADKEYKIIEGQPSDVQKILNQWRHKYELEIISVNSFQGEFENNDRTEYKMTWTIITLTREEL